MTDLIPKVSLPAGARGPWRVETFTVDQDSVAYWRLIRDRRGCRPGTYTRLLHEERGVIMSDTSAERDDHLEFVHRARGDVLINGLGLGMCVKAVLAKPEVTSVTVIEIDADVIELVGPHYSDPRLKIIRADAFNIYPPKGVRFGAVWHDIWDAICADNLPEMTKLKRRYGRVSDWQGAWGEDLCRRINRGR